MKKKLLFIALIVLVNLSFGQNQYISFQTGVTSEQGQNTLPTRAVSVDKAVGVDIEFAFTGASVSQTHVNGTQYNYLHIEGMHKMGMVGAPALPAKNEIIAMPNGAKPVVKIVRADYKDFEGFNIHPALKPARDTEGAPAPEFELNEEIYSADEFFPSQIVEIVNVGKNRGVGLAFAEIRPVQFNPVTQTLRVYSNIQFEVVFEGGAKSFDGIAAENTAHFTNLLKRRVLNSDVIPNGLTGKPNEKNDEAKNYIIITHAEYVEQAQELANWKRQLGYSVEVVAQSSWTAEEVKTAISSRYHNWTPKPDYFVIVGDHSGNFAVPGELHTIDGDSFATDLYYACMDGASDWHPDMARGRISVSNAEEASVVMNKIINYEKNPPTQASFYENGLACAQFQDKANDDDTPDGYAARRFCHTSEEIRDYIIGSQGYTVDRVYYTEPGNTPTNYNNGYYSHGQAIPDELLRSNGFEWDGGASSITSAINAGKFYVFHRDHGYVGGSGWAHPYYTTTSMESLSNGENLPIVFSMNCHTGEFQLNNCFAEKFVRMENKGAVGVVAAAYYSLSGYNDALAVGLIDAIWADPGLYPVMGSAGSGSNYTIGAENSIYTMGDVLNQGLFAMEQNISWYSSRQYEYELFHWFGDPAMRIWTSNPNNNIISANHESTISCDGTTFNISGSVPEATATLVFNGKLIGKALVDQSGNAAIEYVIHEVGSEVSVTISKHNHKPYTEVLAVSGACSFPPQVITNNPTNIGESAAYFKATVVSDGAAAITGSGFVFNSTGNPEIAGVGVIQLQTSPTVETGDFNIYFNGLAHSTKYYVRAYATNENGTAYGKTVAFATLCGVISELPFIADFAEEEPICWDNIDNATNGNVWQFNNPGERNFQSATASNGFAILDSHNYGNGKSQNADLISPALNFTNYDSVYLKFEHAYKSHSNSSATLSYSIDGGSTYTEIQTWSGADEGTLSAPAIFSEDLTAQLAGQNNVRVKWNYTGSWAYYWAIDDIVVTESSWRANTASFKVTGQPDGEDLENAVVNINNLSIYTDANGLAAIDLMDGSYTYMVAKEGYATKWGILEVVGQAVQKSIELKKYYTVMFTVLLEGAQVENAQIEIGDFPVITTDAQGAATIELLNGAYPFTCTYEHYDALVGEINVNNEDFTKVLSLLGIDDYQTSQVKIYPNPNSGAFTVDLPGTFTVSVISELGTLMYSNTHSKHQPIELNDVANGLYLIKIQTQNKIFVTQMVIAK